MKIRIEYKLSSDRIISHRELCAIEATIRACRPDYYIYESWSAGDDLVFELRKKEVGQ